MRQAFLWLLTLCLAASGGVALGRWHKTPEAAPAVLMPAPYPLQKHAFVIVLSGRNNGAFLEASLRSALSQVYEPYRIYYIDDGSTDGSDAFAQEVIAGSEHARRATFVRNETPLGFAANLMRVAASCQPDEILVVPGGDDPLAHEWVLERLNAYYAHSDLWVLYGQALEMPGYRPGLASPYHQESVREGACKAPYLFATYAALAQNIKETDLLYQGRYLPASGELAILMPLLEMGGTHARFAGEVFTLHNREGVFREELELRLKCERHIRSLPPYSPLNRLPLTRHASAV